MQPFCPLDGSPLREVPKELPAISSLVDDRYLVLEHVGTGGMGAIFRAHDFRGQRQVALKVLKPSLTEKENAIQRFFIEARAARALRHPNIVELFDFGVSKEGYLFLAMEFLPGTTVAHLLTMRERLSCSEALLIAFGVTEGLIHAHDHGVVHRDLKPENIFLVAWDQAGCFVKVLDFGVAAVADTSQRGATHRGEVLGTPAYMSPEQVRGDIVDHRSDIYSLGVVLYEMIAGQLPFSGDTPLEVMRAHLEGEVPPLPALPVSQTVRKSIEGLLQCMMAKKPEDRPTNAVEVRARLRAIIANLELECPGFADGSPAPEARSLKPFHERETVLLPEVGAPLPDDIHDRDTKALEPLAVDVARAAPTIGVDTLGARPAVRERPETPWTIQLPQAPLSMDEGEILVSLVHAELEIGPWDMGAISPRDLFAPEMEAFEAATTAAGGCICFDSGDEVRVVFGLYSRDEAPWFGAIRAAADLLSRVNRFRSATGLAVSVRIGIATNRIPAAVARTPSPDTALRGSAVDVAVRLARMAAPGRALVDNETRLRASREWEYEAIGHIRVRGREQVTGVFSLAKSRPRPDTNMDGTALQVT